MQEYSGLIGHNLEIVCVRCSDDVIMMIYLIVIVCQLLNKCVYDLRILHLSKTSPN